jgi:RNA polymerase sigma factor (sigma-70 family)
MAEPTDAELLDRFAAGRDEDAFAELVRRHGGMVQGVCRRVLGGEHDAEDAFQAVFLVLARRAASLPRHPSLGPWLHAVAHRVALKACAARGRRPDPERLREPPPPTEPPAEAARRELIAILDAELRQMPARYRAALVLCYLEGHSYEQAARELGCSSGALRRRLQGARERLRLRLTRRGLAPAAGEETPTIGPLAIVPAGLARATAHAAAEFAAGRGESVAGAALAQAVLSSLRAGPLRRVAVLLVLGLAIGGSALAFRHTVNHPPGGATAQSAAADLPVEPLPERALARLGTTRFRHGDGIASLAIAPDGKLVAAVPGGQRPVILWDAAGHPLPWPAADKAVHASRLVFSPDGRLLACSGSDDSPGKAVVLDTATGRALYEIKGSHAAFSPDGKLMAAARKIDDDSHVIPDVHVYDAAGGRLLRQFRPDHEGLINGLAFAGNRTLAYTTGSLDAETVLHLQDALTGATGSTLRFPSHDTTEGLAACLAFSPEGRRLATAGTTGILVWDVATGRRLRHWESARQANQLAWSPDGRSLLWACMSAAEPPSRRAWQADPESDESPRPLPGGSYSYGAVAFSPGGRWLACQSGDQAVEVREVATGRSTLPREGHTSQVLSVAFDAAGRTLTTSDATTTLRWDRATGRPLGPVRAVNNLASLPGGRELVADEPARTVKVRVAASGRDLVSLEGHYGWDLLKVAPDGRTAVLRSPDGLVRQFDLATGKQVRTFPTGGKVLGLHLSPDGRVLAWLTPPPADAQGLAFGKWMLTDTATGQRLEPPGATGLQPPEYSPDGRVLILPWRSPGVVGRWDLAAAKELPPLEGAQEVVSGVFHSPGSRYLAVSGSHEDPHKGNIFSIRVWELATGRRQQHFDTIAAEDCGATFSPDERMLLSSQRGVIHLREVATGLERGPLRGHLGSIHPCCLAFSPDGRTLASGGGDTQVLLWDLAGRAPDGHWQPTRHSPRRLGELWEALARDDAPGAYRAIWELAADPEGAVRFLEEHLSPVTDAVPTSVRRLLANLDDDDFAVRERASTALARLGTFAEPYYREILHGRPSPEVRRRIARLQELAGEPCLEPDLLREARAVEALEHIDSAAARRLLVKLAGGLTQAPLTREARAALLLRDGRGT